MIKNDPISRTILILKNKIEDLYGNTHEVVLTPGDVLFYESSKFLHGRPKPFNGTWYSSIFVHYYPTDGWQDVNRLNEGHYAIPLDWSDHMRPEDKYETPLVMLGTSFKEPSCPNEWCRTQNSIKWRGPARDGVWIKPSPDFEEVPFHPKQYGDEL